MTTTKITESAPLSLGFDPDPDFARVRSSVFGHLAGLVAAAMSLDHHHTDLYHDALWLDRNLSGSGAVFFYKVGYWSTSIAHHRESLSFLPSDEGVAVVYRVICGLDPTGRYVITTDQVG